MADAQDDFFVSYKWAVYSAQAEELTRHLLDAGYRVWLDRERLPLAEGERIDPGVLKEVLEQAVRASEWMVFFEAFAEAEVALAMTSDGTLVPTSSTAFSWQQFESEHAERIVYVYPSRKLVELASGAERSSFESMQDVAAFLREQHPAPLR